MQRCCNNEWGVLICPQLAGHGASYHWSSGMSRNSRWSTHTHTIYVKTNSAKIYRLSQGILFVHYPPDLILNHYPLSRLSVTCHSSPVQTTQYILHMCVCVCGCQGFPYNCMAACQLYLYIWIYLFQCSQSFLYSIILSDALSNLCTFWPLCCRHACAHAKGSVHSVHDGACRREGSPPPTSHNCDSTPFLPLSGASDTAVCRYG